MQLQSEAVGSTQMQQQSESREGRGLMDDGCAPMFGAHQRALQNSTVLPGFAVADGTDGTGIAALAVAWQQ